MEKITNLDIKRSKIGLLPELSPIKIIGVYRNSSLKSKFEIISLIEILKNRESNYKEAFDLILRHEKVGNLQELVSNLSRQKLEASVIEGVNRAQNSADGPDEQPNTNVEPTSPKSRTKYYLVGSIAVILLLIVFKFPTKNSSIPEQETSEISTTTESSYINLESRDGHKWVYIRVNGIGTRLLLDTGASTVLVSSDYIKRHLATGFLSRSIHYQGKELYTIANGDIVMGEMWIVPSLKIGNEIIENVNFSSLDNIDENSFLLGMSVLNKLGKASIDLQNNRIEIKK